MLGFLFRTAFFTFILSVLVLISTIIYLQQTTLNKQLNIIKQTPTVNVTQQDMVLHFINLPVGKTILIQQGKSGVLIDVGDKEDTEELFHYIQDHGIVQITSIFLTNWTKGNIGGIIPILKRFPNTNLYVPSATSGNYPVLDHPYQTVHAGEKLTLSNDPAVTIAILSPTDSVFHDAFNDSMVVMLQYQKIKVLLTSDIHEEAEKRLITEYPNLKAEIMTVPDRPTGVLHSKPFIKTVDPQTAVMVEMPCSHCSQVVKDAATSYSQEWSDFFYVPIGKNLKIFFNEGKYVTPKNQ